MNSHMENDSTNHDPFSEDERASIIALGNVLRSIHARLVSEGYFLPSGKRWNIFRCASPVFEIVIEPES